MAAQHRAATATAGAACIHILTLEIIDHHATILVVTRQLNTPILLHQLVQQFGAHCAQVPGDNSIVVCRGGGAVLQQVMNGAGSRRRHSCAHITGIRNAIIGNGANMHRPYTHALTLALQHCTAGAGHRPLGTGRPLTAILQRKAELPLAGAKMAGGSCHTALGPGINQHSPHTQGQRHGGACAIQSNGRNVQILNGKSRAHTLIQQVAA